MTKPDFFYRPGELFNIIFQTNLSANPLETIPETAPTPATETTTTTPAQNQSETTPTAVASNEDKELSYSELFSADQQKKISINRYKWKSNKSNIFNITQYSQKYDLNLISSQIAPYTIANAYNRYSEITSSDTINKPFTFFSPAEKFTLFKSNSADNDKIHFQQCKFKINNQETDIIVPLYIKENVSLWKIGPTRDINLSKINRVFLEPNNRQNFRRIVKLMAAILIREVGYMGGRYGGNKAIIQLEYAAVCWAIINQTLSKGFGCEGKILKLFDSIYTLNINDGNNNKMFQDNINKLVKGKATDPNDPLYNSNETDEQIEAREDKNISEYKNKDNTLKYFSQTQNTELYVMAFFEGLINDEFSASTNWSHMQNEDIAFVTSGWRIPMRETINGKAYPRLVSDGENSESSFPSNIEISYGRVYTMIDSKGLPNVLISKGIR